MLHSLNRARSADISRIGRGRVIRTKHVLFSYVPHEHGPSRVAVSVAKKVAKRAVDRNLLKRRCRNAAREALPLLPISIIGIARITDKDATFADFKAELQEIFSRRIAA